jgi:hypothetical protein
VKFETAGLAKPSHDTRSFGRSNVDEIIVLPAAVVGAELLGVHTPSRAVGSAKGQPRVLMTCFTACQARRTSWGSLSSILVLAPRNSGFSSGGSQPRLLPASCLPRSPPSTTQPPHPLPWPPPSTLQTLVSELALVTVSVVHLVVVDIELLRLRLRPSLPRPAHLVSCCVITIVL